MVVPIILGVAVAVLAIGWLITWYRQPPKEENSTIREIKKRIEQVEEDRKTSELKRERDKLAAEMEKKRKQLKEMEEKEKEERKRKETEKKEQEERKREETEKKEQEERQRQEEKQRQENKLEGKVVESKKEEKTAEKPTEEKHEKPTQGKPTEEPAMTEQQFELFRQLQDYEAQMKAKEKELRKQMKRAHVSADTEEAARLRLESGLQPIKWPTADEFHRGRELVQYNPSNVHFAIVGKSGSGKSSLINAFLNLRKGEPGAAATGVTETTATIGRYQDPGQQAPRPWTVWYDVPGAGTQNVSAWQYFINQGLFVFDVILIAIGDRFEETDVQLLRDCHRFKIPALIVRSKADMHIDNLIKEDGGWGESVKREIYQRCRDTFITESKQMVRDELVKAELDDQEVYLVSSYTLRQVYNRSLDGLEDGLPSNVIDEKTLIRDLMLRTVQRRCGDSRAFQAALEIATQGSSFLRSTVHAGQTIGRAFRTARRQNRNPTRVDNAVQEEEHARVGNAVEQEEHVVQSEAPPDYEEVPPEPDTARTRRRRPMSNNRNRTPFVFWTKRVIYLPRAVELRRLHQELNARNPDYAQASAAPPRFLSGTVAVLNFLPEQVIPDEVEVFGRILRLQPYRPRGEQYTNPRGEQSRRMEKDSQTSGRGKPSKPAKRPSGYRSPTFDEVQDEQW